MSKNYSKYRRSWETNPTFRDWIQGVPDKPEKAYCRVCQCFLYAHRYSVLKHSCTMKHQTNLDKFKSKSNNSNTPTIIEGEKSDVCLEPDKNYEERVTLTEDGDVPPSEQFEADDCTHNENVMQEDNDEIIESLDDDAYVLEESEYEEDFDKGDSAAEVAEKVSSNISDIMSSSKPHISTHILNTSIGRAAGNVTVHLYKLINNNWVFVKQSATNSDGRCADLINKEDYEEGRYKLHFEVSEYFNSIGSRSLYPYIEIVFDCLQGEHYHIPLLLNPFGYTTYRGT